MAVIVLQTQPGSGPGQQPGPAAIPAAIGALDVERHRDAAGGAFAHVHDHRRPAHVGVRSLIADHPARKRLAAMAGQRLPEGVLRIGGRRRGGAGR